MTYMDSIKKLEKFEKAQNKKRRKAKGKAPVVMAEPNPWVPISIPLHLKLLGKLGEELNECGSATSRCIIQGVDEAEPVTGKPNRQWLEEEIADVLACIDLAAEHFNLNGDAITARAERKKQHLRAWHAMT